MKRVKLQADEHWQSSHIGSSRDRNSGDEEENNDNDKENFLTENLYELDEYGIPHEGKGKGEGECSDEGCRSPSFAHSFYASGADWTSLRSHANGGKGKTEGKTQLVQAKLHMMWGLKSKEKAAEEGEYKAERKLSSSKAVGGAGMRQQQGVRACPFYKKIPGTSFTVDAFRYGSVDGCSAYFLTHFHADHYGGLSKKWTHGAIYCTPATSRLLKLCLSVDSKYIHPLKIDNVHVIDGTKVMMLEANHCPGAALIYFELRDGRRFLHTGDFRACKEMHSYPIFRDVHINTLYLDTTYCNPKYRFPSQKDVINYVIEVTKNAISKNPKTLVVVGAYSIGKERVFLGIAKALGVQVYADTRRRRILTCLDWPELSERLCSDAQCTFLHVLPMSSLHPEKLKQYTQTFQSQFTSVLAFRPTGWTYSNKIGNVLKSIKPITKDNVTIYGTPSDWDITASLVVLQEEFHTASIQAL
ncbi:DNA cross-link repair protein SNM1 isoform X2 [Cryptomeria japonica]|uniref:DNA cross-link repair protein SNM1 isoform X2 n=1 Tax=Cryptomeria japonica TaxID=3369 RepID=UPI0027DA2699|nr:DNA cross-link repair protein SNM1 isoform X2 [Cryptomeria japonica]